MDDFNPYTAPEAAVTPGTLASEADEGRGVWRDGKALVMSRHARLPSRCVKCNEPATNRLLMTLSWHHPGLYLLFLLAPIGLIIYVVLMLIERRSAKVEVPLCQAHRAGRSRGLVIGWLVAASGLALIGLGVATAQGDPPAWLGDVDLAALGLVVCGVCLLIFGLIHAVDSARVVTAWRIDKTHVWLGKIGAYYLAILPTLPVGDEAGDGKPEKRPDPEF